VSRKKEHTLAGTFGAFLEDVLIPDLRARARTPAVEAVLRKRHAHEQAEERTAEEFGPWADQMVEQVGAAWILSCVFVRTLEDRRLVSRRRVAGEGAADSEHYFYDVAPSLNARDYLLTVFRELSRFPGTEELLGPRGNPAWRLTPSGPAAQALLDLVRERKEDGALRWTFGVPANEAGADTRDGHDTRFLGDLYQDLSQSVRERYALLQTPDFVERFILGLTLEPAIREFGLEEVRVIDPTCGSGHFLLGAYDRLFDARLAARPGLDRRQHALDALGHVYGTDINPYAVAIARFRLTLSFLHKAGIDRLADVPVLPLNLVVADSLLFGARGVTREFGEIAESKAGWGDDLFTLEDPTRAMELFSRGYHAVVGNPPYITCKDAKLRDKYRRLYPKSAAGVYALAAPFTERFFQLAVPSGFVGLINANSFMKREFGKKLIEGVLRGLDLTHVLDTSGAFIPGHGTPTVILVGRNREPSAPAVRAVLGKRGEPETPADPEHGKVWSSITQHLGDPRFENDYVSVADVARVTFDRHPWSLGGGGAADLKSLLEAGASTRLSILVDSIGFGCITKMDEVFCQPHAVLARNRVEQQYLRQFPIGEDLRDWSVADGDWVIFPCDAQVRRVPAENLPNALRFMWPYRELLLRRKIFGGANYKEGGRTWYELGQIPADRYATPLSIAFAFIATHNHFILDRGGKVFNRSAPIIKLPAHATEADHLALLGYLNSSTACFWMKQVSHKKSSASQKHHTDPARAAYEFAGTALGEMPVPVLAALPVTAVSQLLAVAEERAEWLNGEVLRRALDAGVGNADELRGLIDAGWVKCDAARGRAVYLQEELDWWCYAAFGLCSIQEADVRANQDRVASLGSRPFEHDSGYSAGVSARIASDRQARVSVEELPPHWLKRKTLLGREGIRIIESREFKRQWRDTERNVDQEDFRKEFVRGILRSHALKLVERELAHSDAIGCASVRDMTRRVQGGAASTTLRAITDYLGDEPDLLLAAVCREEGVPFLAALRLSEMGCSEKYAAWANTWALQRREDAGEKLDRDIPAPPSYEPSDYRDPIFWRLRGKLDVPKERFITYSGAERDDDKSPIIGWAGWDHLQRAQALAALYMERKNQDGWEKERLKPLLAGLLELVPWLQQWHNDPSDDPAKDRAGEAYAKFVEEEARGFGFTLDDLRAWRPEAAPRKGRRKKSATKAEAAE